MGKFKLAITRNPKVFGLYLFFGITSLWALLEPFISICAPNINRYLFLAVFVPISIIIALIKIYPRNSIKIELKNTNTIVNIKFGDLFSQSGSIAIGVNEFFDSEIGMLVSENSIHGYFINSILGGKSKLFDDEVDRSLSKESYSIIEREYGKSKCYPIGSTAVLEFGNIKYLLFALAKTNDKYEAYTNPNQIFEALDGLFSKARSVCNGRDLNLPLIGTGLSRSGIPPKYLIEMILIAILKATKYSEITKTINIIIEQSRFDQVDLNDIKRKWN